MIGINNIKTLFKSRAFHEPDDGKPYYLVAKNGVYLVRENDCFSASVRVEDALELADHQEEGKWKLPPIDGKMADNILRFTRYIHKTQNTECLLWLYYSLEARRYDVFVPEQKATCGSVITEDVTPTPDGWMKVGTVHSHPGQAFHSKGDIDDERYSDGLHIVIGRLDDPVPDICASVVVNGRRFTVDWRAVFDIELSIPEEWIKKVHKQGEK